MKVAIGLHDTERGRAQVREIARQCETEYACILDQTGRDHTFCGEGEKADYRAFEEYGSL
jgi:hypothetical protein